MSQEIKFENDILVSTLSNPEVSAIDLFQAGLDTKNTGLLTPEEYKKSPVIQKIFSDLNNVFDEQKFNQVYKVAADKYNDLSAIKSWNDLEDDLEYNKRSIFAPLGAKTYDDRFKISRIRNPEKKAKGIDALSAWSESEYSIRELAQMNKIFDTKTQTWRDKTAEELGIFGGLISEPLVYATWDKEGEHFDEFLQRNVRHKKGEYKTDSEGNYYCETLGDREVYGKEVVAYGDILTKENSWLNKIDFFDSDGKTKSTFGTAMKTVAGVVPYLIPGFNKFYGALTASVGLAEVIPTFYKAIEGLVTGDDAKRSELFKFASKQEAFMKKFNGSVSDKSKDSLFNLEQAGNLVVDIFGQLYQMRAAASVSQLFKNTRKAQDDLIKGITKAHAAELDKLPDIQRSAALNRIIKNSKEFQELLKKSSDLASAFSLGYMALTSSADVYSDALQGGYGRRAAAIAALTSVVGQYGIMRHNPISDRLGTWMLDESVGFNVGVDRKALKEALRPLYGEFKTTTEKLATSSVKEAKKGFAGLLAKGSNLISKTKGIFDEGFNTLTSKMLIEGVEEVTEEAVQDMTKGVFDLLSHFGFAGMEGSFGGINNVFSKQGLERYVSSFLGGAVGGGLFHLNTTYIEPFFDKRLRPDIKYSLYNEIANGNTLALLRMVDEICDKDSDLSSYTITVDGELTSGGTSSEKGVSQKEWVKNNIKEHIKSLDAIINGAELNVDDEHLVLQAVRQNELVLRYDNLGLDKLIISDRNKALSKYIEAKQNYDNAKDTTEEEKATKAELKRKAQEALDEVKAIQNGDKAEFYTNAGLILANPYVKGLLHYTDIISYTKNVYNKNYTDLSKEEKEKIEKEYTNFVNDTDSGLVLEALVNTYKDLQSTYGEAFKKYGESINYRTSHKKVLDDLITTALRDSILENQTIYGRDVIEATLRILKKSGIEGFTLEDTLQAKNLNPDDIFSRIKNFDTVIDTLDKYLNNTSLSEDEFKEQTKEKIFNGVKNVLETLPINSINAEIITLIAQSVTNNMINEFVTNLKSNPDFSIDVFNKYLKSKKLPVLSADFDLNNLNQLIGDNIVLEANNDSALLDILLQAGLSYLLSNPDNIDFQLIKSLLERIDRVFKNYINTTITDLKVKAEISKIVHLSISDMKSLESIKREINNSEVIKNKISEEVDASYDSFAGVTTKTEEDTDTYKQIQELFNKFNNSGFIANYEEIIKHKDKFEHNPLYDLLEKLTFQITKDGEVVNLLKVLKNEEQRINEVDSIDEYNNPSVGKETIEKLINALRTAQALVAGMLKGAMYSKQLTGINEQMNYHNKTYGDGNHLLETIDEETAILINTDINNLIHKLNYISALSNITSESLFKNNKQIKAQYNNALLTKYKFIFKDEDIITKEMLDILDDEISDDDYKVNMFEHYLFDAFKKYREEYGLVKAVEKFFGKIELKEADKMKSFGIGIDTNDITNKDLIIRLAAAIMQDSGEFSVIYKNIIEKNKSNSTSFVPFFTLETAIRISSAFAAERLKTSFDPKYTSILDALNKLYKTDNGYIVDFNTLFINGVAGSGKTSIVMSSVLKTLAQKAPTSLKLVIATAPSIKQIDNLKKSLSTGLTNEEITKIGLDSSENKNIDEILKLFVPSDTFTEIELSASKLKLDEDGLVSVKTGEIVKLDISKVKDKIKYSGESSKKPNVIFIDEVTHVAAYKLQLLSEICKQEGIVLITSGDLSQEGKSLAITTGSTTENYLSHIDSICCFQTPLIISSVRNGNIHSRNNNSKFVLALKEYLKAQAEKNDAFAETALRNFLEKHPIALDYYETENELHGYKLTKTLALEDLKRLKNALEKRRTTNPNAKIGIITELDENGNIVDTAFKNQIESILKPDDYELYSYDGAHPKAAQGSEEEYIIVYNPKFDGANISDNFKKLYTMVTRSHLGAIVVSDMSNDIFKYVENISPKTSTGNYTLPIDSYLGKLLNERILNLENISNSTGITSVETLVDLRTPVPATVIPETKEPEPEPEPDSEETSSSTPSVTPSPTPAVIPTTNTSITSKSNTSKSNTSATPASTTSATTKPSSPIKPKSKKEAIKSPELPFEPESKSEPEKKPSSVIAEEKNKDEKTLAAETKEVEEAEKEAGILGNDKAIVYPFYTNLSNALDGTKRYDVSLNLGDIEINGENDENAYYIVAGFNKLKNIFSAEYRQNGDTEFNNEIIKERIKDLLKYAINQQDPDIKAVLYKFLGKEVSDSDLRRYIQNMEISNNILLIGEYYEDSSNAPYLKVNDEQDLHLSDGRKLLTGGIKIEINGKVRYISLFKFIVDTNWYLEQNFYLDYENFYSEHTKDVKQNKPKITESKITLDLLTSRGDSRVIVDKDGYNFNIEQIELKGNFIIGTTLYSKNYTNFVEALKSRPELNGAKINNNTKCLVVSTVPNPLNESDKKYIIVTPELTTVGDLIDYYLDILRGENIENKLKEGKKNFLTINKNDTKYAKYLFSDYSLNKYVAPAIIEYIKDSKYLLSNEYYLNVNQKTFKKVFKYLNGEIELTGLKFEDQEGRLIFNTFIKGYKDKKTDTINPSFYMVGEKFSKHSIPKSILDIKIYPEFPIGDSDKKITSLNDEKMKNFINDHFTALATVEPRWINFPLSGNNVTSSSLNNLTLNNLALNNLITSTSVLTNNVNNALKQEWDTLLKDKFTDDTERLNLVDELSKLQSIIGNFKLDYTGDLFSITIESSNKPNSKVRKILKKLNC